MSLPGNRPLVGVISDRRMQGHHPFHMVGEKYLQVDMQETVVITRLVEGPYPNYELVMPKDNDKLLVVDRDVLEAAVRRVAILSNTQTHQIRFDLEESSAMLSAVSP